MECWVEGALWGKTRKLSGLINVKADSRVGTLKALWKQPQSQLTLAERIPGVFYSVIRRWLPQEARMSKSFLSLRPWRVRLSVCSLGFLSLPSPTPHLCLCQAPAFEGNFFQGSKTCRITKILDVLGVTA